MKKVIKQQLPIQSYKLIDSYSLGDSDYLVCENCGKAIKNIGVVQGSDGKTYHVGMDCAETLTGIGEMDIEYYSQGFVQAKSLRAKIRKYQKQGGILYSIIPPYEKNGMIEVGVKKIEEPDCMGDYYFYESFTKEFISKYMPELKNITLYNPTFKSIPEECFLELDKTKYNFKYEVKTHEKYGYKYAWASIWKNGNMLYEGSNGGTDEKSCLIECVRLYNKAEFNSGLINVEF